MLPSLPERIASRLRVDTIAGCWLWQGSLSPAGYGRIQMGRRGPSGHSSPDYVHRIVYELLRGTIPEGLVIDHLCRVPSCCNPAHCEPVVQRINFLRGESPAAQWIRQGACKRGHPLTPENRYARPDGKGANCHVCVLIRAKHNKKKARERRKSVA